MEEKLISVIVPVYNVEDYLEKCIESIIGQTHHNLEIILVDDGSTDQSGEMCDRYAELDTRIKVIHKSNGGLSDARNAGMAVMTGEYVGFVDSDDWIEQDMYQSLYQLCEEHELDLITARFFIESGEYDAQPEGTNVYRDMTGPELLKYNIFDSGPYVVTNSVWDRLYRREVLEGMFFPVGRKYEDICFTTRIFLRADQCGYLDREVYHYTVREDSIMGRSKLDKTGLPQEIFHDLLPQLKEKAEIIYREGYMELADGALYNYVYRCQEYHADLFGKPECARQRKILSRDIKLYRNRIKGFCCKNYSKYKAFSFYMVWYPPICYAVLAKARRLAIKIVGCRENFL